MLIRPAGRLGVIKYPPRGLKAQAMLALVGPIFRLVPNPAHASHPGCNYKNITTMTLAVKLRLALPPVARWLHPRDIRVTHRKNPVTQASLTCHRTVTEPAY
jgi:hypothetical protein